MATSKRERKIIEFNDQTERLATQAVSQFKVAVENLKLFIPFMHNSILTGDGDLDATNRSEMADVLDPAFVEIMGLINEVAEVQGIFDEDPATYQANLDAYIAANPDVLKQAESKLG